MKNFIFTLAFSLIINAAFSQCNGRYETEIFNSVSKTTITYSDVFSDSEHEMDIYIPDGDTEINRPVIIYMHGGSFYAGNKGDTDCKDFCETFAKKGYVCASINYRLVPVTQILNFLSNNSVQYEEVLMATMDAKAAVRFFRKDFSNGDSYGIDPTTIFVGGYSAGGVTAIHLAYLDSISQLPTSPVNVQNIANNMGGIEGDAGNDGYSSSVSGVISFAGGIHDLNWIDSSDEPLVSCQGTDDVTVNFNCGPALDNPAILDLCGLNAMHPIADSLGIINDKLIFQNEGHIWGAGGLSSPKFVQALDFTTNFLFPLLPCNNTTAIQNISSERKLVTVVDILGRKTKEKKNIPLFYIYSNGEVEKKIIVK